LPIELLAPIDTDSDTDPDFDFDFDFLLFPRCPLGASWLEWSSGPDGENRAFPRAAGCDRLGRVG
jgi:hypothetical protein